MESFTVYTALYNLEREKIDSRSFHEYLCWLRETIKLFPDMTVFHGGELDHVTILNCKLVRKPLLELETFGYRLKVDQILKDFLPKSPDDITFRLSDYALLQFAKFELAADIAKGSEAVIWVDAGISRFVEKIDYRRFTRSINYELQHGSDYVFEVDVKNNFKLTAWAIQDAEVGSCRRVISGGSFLVRSGTLPILQQRIFEGIKDWTNKGIWDNEQVMLRRILPSISGKVILIPQVSGIPGCLPRSYSNYRFKFYRPFQNLIMRLLIRGRGLY